MSNSDTFRPATLSEYVGQPKLKERLGVRVAAAVAEKQPLDHMLLAGPPGTGKTSLANIVAELVGDPFESVTMPLSENTLKNLVSSFKGVLLLDELHRSPVRQQEMLLPLLEFGYLATSNGQRIENGWLTIIGATTEIRGVIEPLWDRFTFKPNFEPYTPEDMSSIVRSMACKAGIELDGEMLGALGQAAGGVPRIARQMVVAAKHLTIVNERQPTLDEILFQCSVSADGLSENHIRYMEVLDSLGGGAGLKPISTMLQLHPNVCEGLERRLVTEGFLNFGGPRGRELSSKGFARVRRQISRAEVRRGL